MIAVIVATGPNPEFHGFDDHLPTPLIHLVDRPFLQHVVESLLRQDLRHFHFVLNHLPQQIEEYFGSGARWGCRFDYHLVPANRDPYITAAAIVGNSLEPVLLGTADYLPHLDLHALGEEIEHPVTFRKDGTQRGTSGWSGWAILPRSFPDCSLLALTSEGTEAEQPEGKRIIVSEALSMASGRDLLRSQAQVLQGAFSHVMMGGLEVKPGVWTSRSVSLDPTVELIAPVYVGAHTKIGPKTTIGPSAVIGDNCFIGQGTKVANSMVCSGTYVGEALEIRTSLVDRNKLLSVEIGTSLSVSDAFLLSDLAPRAAVPIRLLVDRLIAGVLFWLFLPFFLAVWVCLSISGEGRLAYDDVVRLPAHDNSANWKTYQLYRFKLTKDDRRPSKAKSLVFTFLPGLLAVVCGRLSLVGVKPRSASEIDQLPPDWRKQYLATKAGLITETETVFGLNASEEEFYVGESYYGTAESFTHDLRLLAKFVIGYAQTSENQLDHAERPRRA